VPTSIPVAPTPTATPPAPIVVAPPLPAVLTDEFVNHASGFPLQPEGQEGAGYRDNGEYAIVVPEPEGFVIAELAGSEFGDLAIEVDARAVGPTAGGSYGLVFHRREQNGSIEQYFLLLDPEAGTVRLVRWSGTDRTELIPATPSPAIAQGEATNRLAVNARGGQMTVQVNGVTVAQATDPGGPRRGLVALRADAGAAPLTVLFDNFVIRPAR
jgi:hypothetical protein